MFNNSLIFYVTSVYIFHIMTARRFFFTIGANEPMYSEGVSWVIVDLSGTRRVFWQHIFVLICRTRVIIPGKWVPFGRAALDRREIFPYRFVYMENRWRVCDEKNHA